jgi:hypothetical protein
MNGGSIWPPCGLPINSKSYIHTRLLLMLCVVKSPFSIMPHCTCTFLFHLTHVGPMYDEGMVSLGSICISGNIHHFASPKKYLQLSFRCSVSVLPPFKNVSVFWIMGIMI